MAEFPQIVRAFVEGRYAEALSMLESAPPASDVASRSALHGLTLAAMGRVAESVGQFRRAVDLQPDNLEHRINLGNALRESGDNAAAIRELEQAVAKGATGLELDLNLGLAYLQAYRLQEAVGRLDAVVRAAPGAIEPRVHLARAFSELGQRDPVLQLVGSVISRIDVPDLLNQVGVVLNQCGEGARAEEAFRRALQLDPGFQEASQNLASMFERQNRLDEARELLAMLPTGPISATLSVLRAKLAMRDKDNAAALEYFAQAEALPSDDRLRIDLHFDRGKVHDSLGNYDAAMCDFQAGHEASVALLRLQYPDIGEDVEIDDWGPEDGAGVAPARPAFDDGLPPDPIFVVGFPRSGTTLLEQLLDAHPQLQSMDEQLAVESAIDELRALGHSYPEGLQDVDARTLTRVRQRYWREVEKVISLRPGTTLVDKYPFNAVRLPLIAHAFPRARVIMLMRHPADACLSCYMQKFRLNIGTRYWANLESTTALYARMMSTWQAHAQVSPLPIHVLRYEDLVDDMPSRMRELLQFLGLPWDDTILKYADRARQRGRISTPSYSQVVEPIYRRAVDRWRNYEAHLKPYLPALTPFIEKFGYGEGGQPLPHEGDE